MLQKEQDLIAQDIVRCAREVYIILGNGFQEIVYKRALSAEMMLRKIEHQRGYINYDLPDMPETYIHRIGRTGRAGKTGTALTFCAQDEMKQLLAIQKILGFAIPAVS